MYEEVLLLCGTLSHGEKVTVTRVGDGHDTSRSKSASRLGSVREKMNVPDTEELSSSSAEGDVGARKVVDGSLGEHGVVLQLRLAERRGVAGDQDQLGLARAEGYRGKHVSKNAQFLGRQKRIQHLPLRVDL